MDVVVDGTFDEHPYKCTQEEILQQPSEDTAQGSILGLTDADQEYTFGNKKTKTKIQVNGISIALQQTIRFSS